MANDFIYSQRGHAEAAKVLAQMGLDDEERAFAVEQAAIILQPTAMQYTVELASGKPLRPMVVRLSVLRGLIYVKNEIRAVTEGRDRYDYASESSDEADAMIAAKGLTPDEEEFVSELSNETSRTAEREFIVRAQRGQRPIRGIAIAGAFAAALAHADDWEQYGWLKKG